MEQVLHRCPKCRGKARRMANGLHCSVCEWREIDDMALLAKVLREQTEGKTLPAQLKGVGSCK